MDVRVRTTLPAAVTAPATARALACDAVTRGRGEVRADDVALVVSELVTNAVLHGEGEIVLDVVVERAVVHIEVTEAGAQLPAASDGGADADSGRGLLLVGKLAREWGVRPADDGKVVWAELAAV